MLIIIINTKFKDPTCLKDESYYKIEEKNMIGQKQFYGVNLDTGAMSPHLFTDEATCKWFIDGPMTKGGSDYMFDISTKGVVTKAAIGTSTGTASAGTGTRTGTGTSS